MRSRVSHLFLPSVLKPTLPQCRPYNSEGLKARLKATPELEGHSNPNVKAKPNPKPKPKPKLKSKPKPKPKPN